jgi:hypothetical protein
MPADEQAQVAAYQDQSAKYRCTSEPDATDYSTHANRPNALIPPHKTV